MRTERGDLCFKRTYLVPSALAVTLGATVGFYIFPSCVASLDIHLRKICLVALSARKGGLMPDDNIIQVKDPSFLVEFTWQCPHCNFLNHTTVVASLGVAYHLCSECESEVGVDLVLTHHK